MQQFIALLAKQPETVLCLSGPSFTAARGAACFSKQLRNGYSVTGDSQIIDIEATYGTPKTHRIRKGISMHRIRNLYLSTELKNLYLCIYDSNSLVRYLDLDFCGFLFLWPCKELEYSNSLGHASCLFLLLVLLANKTRHGRVVDIEL